ncbi:hypothetical protein E6H34_01120 [Candidatus Bathyarchaeota archaeon]|nr:MAG: hypothetical protein E6H34_01120 [Candidatus Bathyarchaeota archaeon]
MKEPSKANHSLSKEEDGNRDRERVRTILLLVTIVVAAGGTVFGAYYLGFLKTTQTLSSAHFTITMTNQGFNGSKTQPSPWPIMNVVKGQSVTIHVENNDTVEPHGFVISHYFNAGVKLGPGEAHDVVFVANQTGSFVVYCNIFCSVHQSMLNGQLNVNP